MSPEERAFAAADLQPEPGVAARRRLSWLRIAGSLLLIAAAVTAVVGFRSIQHGAGVAAAPRSSFLPYVDVTATPPYAFEDASRTVTANLVLAFVVSSNSDACEPSWGASYSLSGAATGLDLDRRIARLRQRGGQAAISFGGVANSELAVGCTDPGKLYTAYSSVVQRYHVTSIDLDIEGPAASAPAVDTRRAAAIARLQRQQRKAKHPLTVWLTLPVDPSGLTETGRTVLTRTLAAGVDVAGVNGLVMDYGQSLPAHQTMLAGTESALTHLAEQVRAAYGRARHPLSTAQAWQRVGATPMIGQNDTPTERFELADARGLLRFAERHHLRRLSMWSANRDQACGPNYANVSVVAVYCSGVEQPTGGFAKIFSAFRSRTIAPSRASLPTRTPTRPPSIVDNPATSPYPIWNPVIGYPQDTKIVWHRNVYQAKWWTRGDMPDAPVTSAADTPWTLIGPVLPGEHPAPTPTLSAGTYPTWSAEHTYRAGDRVLYRGVGYLAKWYTHGDVPGIAVSDPGQTPWQLITGG